MSCCLRAATRMGKTVVMERGVAAAKEEDWTCRVVCELLLGWERLW